MSVKTSDDSLEPVTSLAITGTLRLRTRTVITVAKIPSVRASSLPLPRPGMLDWSKLIVITYERNLSSVKRLSDFFEIWFDSTREELWWAGGDSRVQL